MPQVNHTAPGDPGDDPIDWDLLGAAAYADRPLGRGGNRPFGHLDSETKEDWIVIARAVIAAYTDQMRALGMVVVSREDLEIIRHFVRFQVGRTGHVSVDGAFDRVFAALAAVAPELAGETGGEG